MNSTASSKPELEFRPTTLGRWCPSRSSWNNILLRAGWNFGLENPWKSPGSLGYPTSAPSWLVIQVVYQCRTWRVIHSSLHLCWWNSPNYYKYMESPWESMKIHENPRSTICRWISLEKKQGFLSLLISQSQALSRLVRQPSSIRSSAAEGAKPKSSVTDWAVVMNKRNKTKCKYIPSGKLT